MWRPSPTIDTDVWLFRLAMFAILIAAIGLLAAPVLAAVWQTSNSYNEGWNAYWSDVARHAGHLYPPQDSAISNNYPPLSFYIVGGLSSVTGDPIFTERALAFVSVLAVAINISLWLRVTGSSLTVSAAGACVWLAVLAGFAPDYAATADPQLIAHAVMMTALTLLWRKSWRPRDVVLACLLMITAGSIKHLLIALPVTVTIWLLWHSRRLAVLWFLTSIAVLAALAALAWRTYGPVFFQALDSAREYHRYIAVLRTRQALLYLWPVLLPIAIFLMPVFGRGKNVWALQSRQGFALLYLGVAAIVGAAVAGGEGVDHNAFFEFLIAATLCSMLAVEELWSIQWRNPKLATAMRVLPIALIAAVFSYREALSLPHDIEELKEQRELQAQTREDIQFLAQLGTQHQVACELLALCYWAGLPFTVDVFNYGEKLKRHEVPADACESLFITGPITVLQRHSRDPSTVKSPRLPARCNDLIYKSYRLIRTSGNGQIWLRR